MENLIRDGFTEPAYLAAVPRMHAEIRFEFRPMLYREREFFREKIAAGGQTQVNAMAAAIAAHVVHWDVLGEGGKAAAITVDNVSRLRPIAFAKMYDVIAGYLPSDIPPEANGPEAKDATAAELAAKLETQYFGDAKQEAAVKNLGMGS